MPFFNGRAISDFFFYTYCITYDFFYNLGFSNLDLKRRDLKKIEIDIYRNHYNKQIKDFLFKIVFDTNFSKLEFFINFFNKIRFSKVNYKNKIFRSYFRVLSNSYGFYFNFLTLNNKNKINNLIKNSIFSGFNLIWNSLRLWFVFFLMLLIIYFSLIVRSLPFNKIVFAWIGITMFCYWLISGFVFFVKKYQFGKYTSVIQRFWKRSYILFWLIEAGTFSVFLFLTINASQESFYMFDQISFYKTHLYSWKLFILKLFPIILLIIVSYFMLVSLKWNILTKHTLFLLFLTLNLTYVVWLEFYQFFHVLNFYGNLNWIYDIDEHTWVLELEPRRTRIVNHYVMLLFILKFWHIVFIYGFWIFFVLRVLEIGRIRYPLLSANFQNFIILYIFAWVFMYPWFKFFFKNFLYAPYYWFYVNNRRLFVRVLFNDFKLIYYGLCDYLNFYKLYFLNKFNFSFFYWRLPEFNNNFESFRKNIIKNNVLKNL